jgi:mutator protein MutT
MHPQIVAAVLRTDDRILLCHRSPTRESYPNVWDLPGGHIEPGESAPQALARELQEELGIQISEPTQPPLSTLRMDTCDLYIWLIDDWTGTAHNAAPDEHDDLAWVQTHDLDTLTLAHPEYLALFTTALTANPAP